MSHVRQTSTLSLRPALWRFRPNTMTAPFLFPIAVQAQPAVGYTSGDLCAYHQFLDQTDMPRWQPDNPSAPSRQYTHLLAQPRVGSRSCRVPSVACFETD